MANAKRKVSTTPRVRRAAKKTSIGYPEIPGVPKHRSDFLFQCLEAGRVGPRECSDIFKIWIHTYAGKGGRLPALTPTKSVQQLDASILLMKIRQAEQQLLQAGTPKRGVRALARDLVAERYNMSAETLKQRLYRWKR